MSLILGNIYRKRETATRRERGEESLRGRAEGPEHAEQDG